MQLFDQRWHKIMLGVTNEYLNLWVDCQPVRDVEGNLNAPLETRGRFDTNNGYVSVSRYAETSVMEPESPVVDLQWMVMNCDPTRPARGTCDELPLYDVAHVGSRLPIGEEPKADCNAVCPPGYNGTDVSVRFLLEILYLKTILSRVRQVYRVLRGFRGLRGNLVQMVDVVLLVLVDWKVHQECQLEVKKVKWGKKENLVHLRQQG